jgi:hypothetical protein
VTFNEWWLSDWVSHWVSELQFTYQGIKHKLTLWSRSVRTAKKTQHFNIIKINWLTLFKEIIPIYTENHAKPRNTKCSVTNKLKQLVHIVTIRL